MSEGTKRRVGRRPGGADTRAIVLASARKLFGDVGYDAATIRAIAVDADVDPALVIQFYGNKEGLFRAVLDGLATVREQVAEAGAGPVDDRGVRLTRAYFDLWEDPVTGDCLRSLARGAIGSPRATATLQDFMGAIIDENGGPHQGYALAGGQLLGIAIARYVLAIGPVAQMPLDDLVAALAPSVQIQLESGE